MSRHTVANIVKVTLAIAFFIFMPFIVPILGIVKKNWKVIVEGVLYSVLFVAALSIDAESPLSTLSSFVGLGSIVVSAVRFYMLRDLWLSRKAKGTGRNATSQPNTAWPAASHPSAVAAPVTPSTEHLSQSLAWVATQAKQNKHRLPADAYVSVLEICHTLDAVVDAETRQPLGDPQFEYELTATVREYLPAVVRGYLAIPPSMVENRQANGRTANEELVEQLQLLARQAETLHASRHRQTSMDLSNTGNFLRERFGHQQGGFDFGIK
ncbi:hypothetical protein LJ753_10065 [Arthrobacter sp. zg-Y20]|uniref:hypothetical protein n=1 Tax=unclassified Arthrobacter TaxID=235627 RepID=UPI001D13ABB9|nr:MULTISPECIES: hypothetical protein [unclassified Arthrobacter]MCC3276213.1 hypothetical protein [Arthrobacter sp. zg-Y20]MDK1316373.1 hypothetical protein [Arthrobacter sp. zg.Y20]WIB06420.1 hypothetical protein QNO06_01370 [Arthrobacter sp. zg-Y20]